MSSTVTISELQGQTPKIIRDTERRGFTSVTRHGKIVAVMMSKERMEAMIETMELMNNVEFMDVLEDYKAGKLTFKAVPHED
jgi:PHD/YefM family antitoxin component YafN of YafNO toxin-antitoxin module